MKKKENKTKQKMEKKQGYIFTPYVKQACVGVA